ncbi:MULTISPECIES: alpha/beta fold hydrolase [Bacillota]|uniref:Alpha/beta fold hydrolase n=2 Tax=Amedibacillus TaxID=2749846 RepID=A0A7G9GM35_9FIRM|nr:MULTISPECIES: alpha/beta fold hydrolase [Bacillota]QNM11867.1 alpha/beta fold hydrolase [[Eubacterium] hominis]MCH4287210.1 lysophospholipase [Amedibacillus hominis]RGB50625.1 alpha/beta fold hydrolase [Absiella sp. AM22-9]RGB62902.1 alpha/beta fold hydrolase [Absiella sp. AM10-20]RGB64827.1 alpha/beta fold hydrolase [Absiella sp. AM09-45]
MAKIQGFTFPSEQDQLIISAVKVVPDTPIVGVIQMVHGMAEHKERYLPFMQFLAQHGYVCVMHDHRGHGKSIASKDDLGYFHDKTGDYLIEDIHQLTKLLKTQYPDAPFFLFGHSMGSLLVRCYCKRYDDDIDALVVCGSPSENKAAKAGKLLVKAMEKIKGEHYRSPLIQKMAFGSNNKAFSEDGSENVWLCSDQNVVKAYDEDPLCGFIFTLNGFENLFTIMMDVYDANGWAMKHKDLPIRFIAGSEDPCIGNETKFKQAAGFMKERGYTNVSARLFEGKRHEILNEDIKEEVYEDVLAFYELVRKQ